MIFSAKAIAERRKRVSDSLSRHLNNDDVVLIGSGRPLQRPGGWDQVYPFIPHPDYYWISGFVRPGGLAVFSKAHGWTDFVNPVALEEKIWGHVTDEAQGLDIAGFAKWLQAQAFSRAFVLGNTQNLPEMIKASADSLAVIQEAFSECRRIKDSEEIALIETISEMALAGYRRLKNTIRPGISEREIQVEFEGEIFRAGADAVPYETIVGAGDNASILHALPTQRRVKDQDLILIDAGAARHHYCVDITRVFSAKGKFTQQQQSIYDLVLAGQIKAMELCRPGIEWKDVHLAAARVMAEGLRALKILKVDANTAIESGVIGVFFPHGVGHMVGLQVRDVGGRPNANPKKYAGTKIRLDMPLKAGYLMTVEPGLYFINDLLNSDEIQRSFKDQIDWTELKHWREMGGVRIEDNLLIRDEGPKNLTSAVEK